MVYEFLSATHEFTHLMTIIIQNVISGHINLEPTLTRYVVHNHYTKVTFVRACVCTSGR
jgi:hypothetical protein